MNALNLQPPGATPATKAKVFLNGQWYESRMNCCYNRRCGKCYTEHGRIPSHGPYWYLVVKSKEGQWLRLYIGKEMDLDKWRNEDGSLDWDTILAKRTGRAAARAAAIPGGPQDA